MSMKKHFLKMCEWNNPADKFTGIVAKIKKKKPVGEANE